MDKYRIAEIERKAELSRVARELDRKNPPKVIGEAFDRIPEVVRVKIEYAENNGRRRMVMLPGRERWNVLIINTLNDFGYKAYRDILTVKYESHEECHDIIRVEW